MVSVAQDGFYTKTQAYNLLKEFLEVPKSYILDKRVFPLFFKHVDGTTLFTPIFPLDMIKETLNSKEVHKMVNFCSKLKKQGNPFTRFVSCNIVAEIGNRLK